MTDGKLHIDFAFVVPLAEELEALIDAFGFKAELTVGDFQISELKSPNSDTRVCLIKQDRMGHGSARDVTRHLLDHYSVGILCSFGIAGALSDDVKLGDVCVSQTVIDLTDGGKIADDKRTHSPKHYRVERGLCTRLAFLTENPPCQHLAREWRNACGKYINDLLRSESGISSEGFGPGNLPSVRFGSTISYVVVGSNSGRKELLTVDRKALAVETEAAAVFDIAEDHENTFAMSVRGISDYSDSQKNRLEVDSKNQVRTIAAKNAALYMVHQLKNPAFVDYVKLRRVNASAKHVPVTSKEDKLQAVISAVESHIHEKLQETCPAYRSKSKGYVLPPPRISMRHTDGALSDDRNLEIHEIRSAVERYDRVMISPKLNYPDRALPWVIADHILRTNGERIYLPIVVNRADIRPNRFHLGNMVAEQYGLDGVTPVVILDDPDINSKNCVRLILDESAQYPDVKFVVVLHDGRSKTNILEFCVAFSCQNFLVEDFSLDALSDFMLKNFDLQPREAGVVAVRLHNLFEQFDMHAHPSYFAGISQDVLTAMMDANRRGELIGLAVEGILMLLVASDTADVRVSKAFRRKFLTQLVVAQSVEKTAVREENAIRIAKTMAKDFDVEIDPMKFLSTFTDAGIMYFDYEDTVLTFSYIRDYLLADYLSKHPDVARKHFDFDNIGADFNVLNLYAEIGADEDLIDNIISLIESDITMLDQKREKTRSFLIEDYPSPNVIKNPISAQSRRRKLRQAIEYVGRDEADLRRKQKILDFKNSISYRVADNVNLIDDDAHDDGNEARDPVAAVSEDDIPRDIISGHWHAGCAVIGAGAEGIRSGKKRQLASLLIRLGNRIADTWTVEFSELDFGLIKDSVLSTPEFMQMKNDLSPSEWEKLREDFDRALDDLEYHIVSLPYRYMLLNLCATGQGNILRLSVKECEVSEPFDRVTKSIWACDLDASASKRLVHPVLREMGNARLLRHILAEHLISRVYWEKWKIEDRRNMLDIASDFLRPLGVKFDKGKISREIKRSS